MWRSTRVCLWCSGGRWGGTTSGRKVLFSDYIRSRPNTLWAHTHTPQVALYPRNENLLCHCLLQWLCDWELNTSRGAFAFDYIPHIVKGGSCWDTVGLWAWVDLGPQKSFFHLSHLMKPLASEVCFQRLMSFTFHSVEPYVFHAQTQCMMHSIEKGSTCISPFTREGHSGALTSNHFKIVETINN